MFERILENPKTTIAGLLTGIASIVAFFGYNVSSELVTSATAIIVAVLGLFAKD